MIIVRITAGMGNQMSIYSAALALAHRLDTELLLDIREFWQGGFRSYALGVFPNINERQASFREIWSLWPFQAVAGHFRVRGRSIFKHPFRRILYEVMSRAGLLERNAENRKRKPGSLLFPVPFSRVYFEVPSSPEEFSRIPDNTFITGNYGGETYFENCPELVRMKFRFPEEYFHNSISAKIKACNSVALHIRRTDKVKDKLHIPSSERYIRQALEKISSLTEKPEFFVFSDDIEWCKYNLRKIYEAEYNFVEHQTSAQDMALITVCRHVITGPSSFSWWGAWLNEMPSKIVITPDVNLWFHNPQKVINSQNMFPAEWIKIS